MSTSGLGCRRRYPAANHTASSPGRVPLSPGPVVAESRDAVQPDDLGRVDAFALLALDVVDHVHRLLGPRPLVGDPERSLDVALQGAPAFHGDIVESVGAVGIEDGSVFHRDGGRIIHHVVAGEIKFAALDLNPSIAGVKSEDTILVTDSGMEVLTAIDGWPLLPATVAGMEYPRPAILEVL